MASCQKSTLKKYSTRPGPPFPAQECHGEIKKGNDGAEYKSIADARGNKNTYLIIENVYIPNNELDMFREPYTLYYNFDKKHKHLKQLAKQFKNRKQIYDRVINMETI